MEKTEKKKNRFGLIGKDISYSFSQNYFSQKFSEKNLNHHSYENFDLNDIGEIKDLLKENQLMGLNVTIPYKEAVIPFLKGLDHQAKTIGAVNTIKFTKKGLIGFNTDAYGFEKSLTPLIKSHHKKALILGTGGASKAIAYVFDKMGIDFSYVSRTPSKNQFLYEQLNEATLNEYHIIVNCSPVGTFPKVQEKPQIPYKHLSKKHLLFDLIYNPHKTSFLQEGESQGAMIQNGLQMLQHQAEKAWQIWNESP